MALLFGFAANADNLAVGAAYGVGGRRIAWRHNLLIAVVTTAITVLALLAGRRLRDMLPGRLPDALGGCMLIALAGWSFWRDRGRGGAAMRAGARDVPLAEILVLAGALSVNNIGLAIGEGLGGVGLTAASASVFGFSVVLLALGQGAGARFGGLSRIPAYGNGALALAGLLMLSGF